MWNEVNRFRSVVSGLGLGKQRGMVEGATHLYSITGGKIRIFDYCGTLNVYIDLINPDPA